MKLLHVFALGNMLFNLKRHFCKFSEIDTLLLQKLLNIILFSIYICANKSITSNILISYPRIVRCSRLIAIGVNMTIMGLKKEEFRFKFDSLLHAYSQRCVLLIQNTGIYIASVFRIAKGLNFPITCIVF